ncbi:UNVERIFIED_CONTAM: hypothetical protein FKN15_007836 [Acipenser sinensis]
MGHALKDSNTGEKLEPVKVFVPHEKTFANQNDINLQSSESSPNNSPCKKLSNAVTEKMAKVTAYDLISNQTVRQPMSASAIFRQEMRPRILEENPKASLQEITSSVEDLWKNLSEEEKKKFGIPVYGDTEIKQNPARHAANPELQCQDNAALGSLQASPQAPNQSTGVAGAQ